jgi:glycosyltransferase involved in cell wall biosynthesis
MPNMPIVSVIMAVYNGGSYVSRAIESILRQRIKDFEFIIIDDGSTDNTLQILRGYSDPRIKILLQNNTGLTVALNRGIACAQGKYVARIDADDEAKPHRFETQLRFMEVNSEYVLIGSWAEVVADSGDVIELRCLPETDLALRWALLFDNAFVHSSLFMRRDCLNLCNGYDKTFLYSQDYDLIMRMDKRGKIANIPEFLVKHLYNVDTGISVKKWTEQKGFAEKVSMRMLNELLGEGNISLEARRAAWQLINRPWQIKEPETSLAVKVLMRIAHIFCEKSNDPESQAVIRNSFALYAKRLLLPVTGGRVNQLQNLRAAIKLDPYVTHFKNVVAAIAYATFGPEIGIRRK